MENMEKVAEDLKQAAIALRHATSKLRRVVDNLQTRSPENEKMMEGLPITWTEEDAAFAARLVQNEKPMEAWSEEELIRAVQSPSRPLSVLAQACPMCGGKDRPLISGHKCSDPWHDAVQPERTKRNVAQVRSKVSPAALAYARELAAVEFSEKPERMAETMREYGERLIAEWGDVPNDYELGAQTMLKSLAAWLAGERL